MNKSDYIEKAKSLGLDVQDDFTNAQLKKLIENKEAELAELEVETETDSEENQEVDVEKLQQELKAELLEEGIYLDDRGRKYKFTKDAPKKINIDGAPMTQREILETEEVISELVYGNNGFIKRVYNG
jgi:hypothetical protein